MMHQERRVRRSDEKAQALFYQLDTCRQRARLEAMILADRDGLCVATAGGAAVAEATCEEIAAHMAMMGPAIPQDDGMVLASGTIWDVHVRRFEMAGQQLYMCAVGGAGGERARQVRSSVRGVTRILDR